MNTRRPAWVNEMTAQEARLSTGLLVTPATGEDTRPGRVRSGFRPGPGTPGRVSQATGSGPGVLSVDPFQAVMDTDEGPYLVTLPETHTIRLLEDYPPEEVYDRTDLIAALLTGTADSRALEIVVLTGQESEGWEPPEPEGPAIRLALVRVAANAEFVLGTDIRALWREHPFTCAVGGVLPVRDEAARPVNPHQGLYLHRLDTGDLESFHRDRWQAHRRRRDTGWLEFTGVVADWTYSEGGTEVSSLRIRRVDDTVHLAGRVAKTTDEGRPTLGSLADYQAFLPSSGSFHTLVRTEVGIRRFAVSGGTLWLNSLPRVDPGAIVAGEWVYLNVSWHTDAPWEAGLPDTPTTAP
ncbi:hypothetical protein [Nocardiopsis synnemataformans]|uniref:hypothetical protein n=1 Tax=Nocardiopsis synnemataformans TaxID=61305 RepID=UPI003EBAF6CC